MLAYELINAGMLMRRIVLVHTARKAFLPAQQVKIYCDSITLITSGAVQLDRTFNPQLFGRPADSRVNPVSTRIVP